MTRISTLSLWTGVLLAAGLALWTLAPSRAVDAQSSKVTAGAAQWTCPMHPEVVSNEKGRCPKCNMFLVEKTADAHTGHDHGAHAPPPPATPEPRSATPEPRSATPEPRSATPEPRSATPEARAAPREARPATRTAPAAPTPAPPPTEATPDLWTCPMHPEVLTDQPGSCPICGMDLVRREAKAQKSTRDSPAKKPREILYWVAPMDPSYRRDGPGKSPMGMDLVPVYADEGESTSVDIDPVVVQNMGVRTALVQRGSLSRRVRTVGQVQVAENQLSVVNLRVSGWVERIHVDETGVRVRKGQPLFDIYSPELLSAQEEYLLALRTAGANSALAKSARRRLELFGLRDWQVEKLDKQRAAQPMLTVTAPQAGFVIHKNVVAGARVKAGEDLYRIGDLSTVWVEAEVYEADAPFVAVGAPATVEVTFQPGHRYLGQVSYVYPTLNERSRTLRVRIEMPNADLRLRPGSFATVSLEVQQTAEVLVVPTESIIHSGTRQLVFVALDLGRYEPREIRTGLVGHAYRTEVLEGLREGERVVTSGQFLLDSESQLQEAVQKMLEARLHARQPRAPGATSSREQTGKTYYTCGMHPQIVQEDPGTCPICGMDLTPMKR